MIIDSLTHVTSNGRWFQTEYDASQQTLEAQCREHGLTAAVVVPIADFIDNETVISACGQDSVKETWVTGVSFNPAKYATPSEAVSAFQAEILAGPGRVLKLHPRMNRYDPLDPRCLAILETLAGQSKPIPVWLDTFFYCPKVSLKKSPINAIHDLAITFPKITFVLLHACGSDCLNLAQAIRQCKNTYLDISYSLYHYEHSSVWGDMRYLVQRFEQRMTWGSDFPEISIGEALETFYRLVEGIPEKKWAPILGENMAKILKLKS